MSEANGAADITRHATTQQVIKINDLLRGCIKPLPEGLCTYTNGEDDQSIADKVGCGKSSVSRVRAEMFGRLFRRQSSPDEEVSKLQAQVHELTHKLNTLLNTLSVNRIVDVKHLRITEEVVMK